MKTHTYVVIMNGTPQSGKDSFVDACTKYCDVSEYANVCNVSSVEPLKDMLSSLGWDGKKTPRVRQMLADLKEFWASNQNGPTQFLLTNIMAFHASHVFEDNIFFTHIREPEEIHKLLSVLSGMEDIGIKTVTIMINRNYTDDPVCKSDVNDNITNFDYDIIIDNDGTLDDLGEQAIKFVNELIDKEW